MKIRILAANSLLAAVAIAQPTLFRADVKPDRTSERYQAVLTLRYTSLDVTPLPGILWGNPIGGFASLPPPELQVTPSAVIVHMSPDETEALDKMAAGGRTPFLYIHALHSGGKPMPDQFVEIWALKPKLSFVQIVGKLLQVQENYIPPALEKFKTDGSAWDLRDEFHRAQPIQSVRGTEDPGERILTFRLATTPANGTNLDLKLHAPSGGQPAASVNGITTSAAPQATKDDPSGKANQYVALLLTSKNGADPVYGVDARFKQRVYKTELWGGFFGFSPNASIKANSRGTDDENSASVATSFEWLYPFQHTTLLRSVYISAAPKLESDKNLVNKNGLLDFAVTLLSPAYGTKNFFFRPSVNVGTEVGGNIHNSLAQLDGNGILRGKGGAELATGYELKRPWMHDIDFTLSFIHRQLFESELVTRSLITTLPGGTLTDSSGATTMVPPGTLSFTSLSSVSSGTRNYLEARLHFGLTESLELFFSYNRGSLPPVFQTVDKVQLGVAYRRSSGDK